MPVYKLIKTTIFPSPSLAEPDGLLAMGGDLKPQRLLLAYANGIFPWFSRKPILWWSPDPRCILFPSQFKITKSFQQIIHKHHLQARFDTCFRTIIEYCATVKRPGENGTWITKDMINAYCKLHELGYAHSVEIYSNNQLCGGLYGVSLGGTFFGESMFHLVSNASKVALYHLVEFCKTHQFDLIDNQTTTAHLLNQGAQEIPREEFILLLNKSLQKPTLIGNWGTF